MISNLITNLNPITVTRYNSKDDTTISVVLNPLFDSELMKIIKDSNAQIGEDIITLQVKNDAKK